MTKPKHGPPATGPNGSERAAPKYRDVSVKLGRCNSAGCPPRALRVNHVFELLDDRRMTIAPMHEPRPPRFGIHHPSTLVRADGTETPVVIINISQSGFRVKMAETPLIGEKVVLRGDVGDVPAQIRWTVGDTAGGYFLRPRED